MHAVLDQEHRYSLSTEVATGRHQLQVQIAAGVVDYEVVEDLDPAAFAALVVDPEAAQQRVAHLRSLEAAAQRTRRARRS